MDVTRGCIGRVLGSQGNHLMMRSGSVQLVLNQNSRGRRRKAGRGKGLINYYCIEHKNIIHYVAHSIYYKCTIIILQMGMYTKYN